MTRENVLFSVIGVLLGYVVAFTLVTYINHNGADAQRAQQQQAAAGGEAVGDLPPDHPQVSEEAARNRQALLAELGQAEQKARQEPADFDAQLKAASLNAQAGKFEEAIDFLARANKLRPGDYETVVQLGNANYEAGRYDVAERWYKEALAKNPDDVNVRTDLGLTYFVREKPDTAAAIAEFRRSLERDPAHAATLHNLTLALIKSGDPAEAERTLARLEKLNPKNPNLPVLRAELEKARGTGRTSAAAAGDAGQ